MRPFILQDVANISGPILIPLVMLFMTILSRTSVTILTMSMPTEKLNSIHPAL